LIAGADCNCNDGNSVSSLAELRDVLISEDLNTDSLLVYSSSAAAWVNKTLEDLIFVGATG